MNRQTFNDGVLTVYEIINGSEPAGMPKKMLSVKGKLNYDEKTVGINRYESALQNNVQISKLLRVMRKKDVSTQDVVILEDEKQYQIVRIQYPEDIVPQSMDLSLERIEQKYEIA